MGKNEKTISRERFKDETGIGLTAINNLIASGIIRTSKNRILLTEVERIIKQKELFPSVRDFISYIQPEFCIDDKNRSSSFIEMIENNTQIPTTILLKKDTVEVAYDKSDYYIDTTIINQKQKRIMCTWLAGYKQTNEEKVKIILSFLKPNYPVFVTEMNYYLSRCDRTYESIRGLLIVADTVQSVTSKDVPGWTEYTMIKYNNCLFSKSKCSWKVWQEIQFELREKGYLKGVPIVYFDKNKPALKLNIKGYPLEQFAMIMQYSLNSVAINANHLIEKALNNEKYANLWLFVAMHFISAWRKEDYLRLPRPYFFLTREEIKNMWESNNHDRFKQMAEIFEMQIMQHEMKPTKTEKYYPPTLKIYLPESCKATIGLIISILATYGSSKEPLLTRNKFSIRDIEVFFGQEMVKVLDYKAFSNRRANKSLMTAVMIAGDRDVHVVSGYLLAGLLRSHTLKYCELPPATKHYISAIENNSKPIELIVSQLFERGTCGFAVLKLIELLFGEEKVAELSFEGITQVMVQSEIHPLQAEQMLKLKDDAERKAKELIVMMRSKKSNPSKVLEDIAFGRAKDKDGMGYCFAKAMDNICLEKNRSQCKHCRFEVLTVSMINRLIEEYGAVSYRKQVENNIRLKQRDEFILARIKGEIVEILTTTEAMSEIERSNTIAEMVERSLAIDSSRD